MICAGLSDEMGGVQKTEPEILGATARTSFFASFINGLPTFAAFSRRIRTLPTMKNCWRQDDGPLAQWRAARAVPFP